MHPRVCVAVDSAGFKTTIRGGWLSSKWARKRKGWVKLYVSADTEKIMASRISITSKKSHDVAQFSKLVMGNEVRVFAGKAYDSSLGGYSMHWRIRVLRPLFPEEELPQSFKGDFPFRGKTVRKGDLEYRRR